MITIWTGTTRWRGRRSWHPVLIVLLVLCPVTYAILKGAICVSFLYIITLILSFDIHHIQQTSILNSYEWILYEFRNFGIELSFSSAAVSRHDIYEESPYFFLDHHNVLIRFSWYYLKEIFGTSMMHLIISTIIFSLWYMYLLVLQLWLQLHLKKWLSIVLI